jgi:hypothetical protein
MMKLSNNCFCRGDFDFVKLSRDARTKCTLTFPRFVQNQNLRLQRSKATKANSWITSPNSIISIKNSVMQADAGIHGLKELLL